jgi:hypothetical protein
LKEKKIKLIEERQEELTAKHQELTERLPWLRPCDPSKERQELLEKGSEILWDKVVVYEKYSEEEKLVRDKAVDALRKHEERMFGKIQENEPKVQKEPKEEQSLGSEEPDQKKPRVKMMRTGESPPDDEVDQRLNELIQRGDAVTLEFNVLQEESRVQQRLYNLRHIQLVQAFQRQKIPCYKDLLDLSHEQITTLITTKRKNRTSLSARKSNYRRSTSRTLS